MTSSSSEHEDIQRGSGEKDSHVFDMANSLPDHTDEQALEFATIYERERTWKRPNKLTPLKHKEDLEFQNYELE